MSWCTEISSSISRSHSYMKTINNNSLLCGSDCKPYVYILLNSSQVQLQCNVSSVGFSLALDTRGGVAEGALEWRDNSLNQLWLKHLTYAHFTKYVTIWTSYHCLSKPWKGLAQARDHETNLISLREHLCKVAQVKMNGRDPAWRQRQLSGTGTKHVWETMKKKGTFDFSISSLIVDRLGWFILVGLRVGGRGGNVANSTFRLEQLEEVMSQRQDTSFKLVSIVEPEGPEYKLSWLSWWTTWQVLMEAVGLGGWWCHQSGEFQSWSPKAAWLQCKGPWDKVVS